MNGWRVMREAGICAGDWGEGIDEKIDEGFWLNMDLSSRIRQMFELLIEGE